MSWWDATASLKKYCSGDGVNVVGKTNIFKIHCLNACFTDGHDSMMTMITSALTLYFIMAII